MGHQPAITVVIPAYNKAAYIKRAISSVIAQSYTNWKLIVIDDGSTDGTDKIALSFQDPRIRVVRQSNQGVSAARNKGVAESNTDWVAFLDADDEWLPGFLEAVLKGITLFPEAVLVFTNGFVADGSVRTLSFTDLPSEPFAVEDYCGFYLAKRDGVNSSRVAVRRKTLISAGGFPVGVTNWEDLDTWARVSWSGKVICIPTPQSIRYGDVPGSASKVDRKRPTGYARIWETFREWRDKDLIPNQLLESAEQYASYFAFWYILALIRARDMGASRKAYRELGSLPIGISRRRILRLLFALPGNLGSYVWDGISVSRKSLRKVGYTIRLNS